MGVRHADLERDEVAAIDAVLDAGGIRTHIAGPSVSACVIGKEASAVARTASSTPSVPRAVVVLARIADASVRSQGPADAGGQGHGMPGRRAADRRTPVGVPDLLGSILHG
ncbi:hypothetical protein ACTIVE_6236 [Actinomadura verrucosospora]|uniref:Uncharacterized protein n=1 Tax=Actinomadura verrucosospora TaxID=46165 RepID=A0A7D4ATH5_ACTVE|nr:hypothetical protein ACTIVE_6236 [Actinomadura verrucosospora]